MATVDVLVPTYNRSAMLRQCLESIQAQTYTDIRVIIGDNCSDDDTRVVAQDFCDRDSRFSYVRNATNLGMYGNMNALFTRVTAPYVHFMHDDDWLEPSFYERMIAGLEESPEAGLAWPGAIVFQGETGTAHRRPDRFSRDQVVPGEVALRELLRDNFVIFPSAVLRTSVLHEVGSFSEYLTADWLMWLRIALHHDLKFIDAPLFHYRMHQEQGSADQVRLAKDVIDMLTFAEGLEEFSAWKTDIAAARYQSACDYIVALKDEPHASEKIRELSSYFLGVAADHHAAIRTTETMALAYAVGPGWLRLGRESRVRHWLHQLVAPWKKG